MRERRQKNYAQVERRAAEGKENKKKIEGNGDGGESEWIKLWNYYCFNNNFMQLKHASISQFYEYFKAAVVAASAQQQQRFVYQVHVNSFAHFDVLCSGVMKYDTH